IAAGENPNQKHHRAAAWPRSRGDGTIVRRFKELSALSITKSATARSLVFLTPLSGVKQTFAGTRCALGSATRGPGKFSPSIPISTPNDERKKRPQADTRLGSTQLRRLLFRATGWSGGWGSRPVTPIDVSASRANTMRITY